MNQISALTGLPFHIKIKAIHSGLEQIERAKGAKLRPFGILGFLGGLAVRFCRSFGYRGLGRSVGYSYRGLGRSVGYSYRGVCRSVGYTGLGRSIGYTGLGRTVGYSYRGLCRMLGGSTSSSIEGRASLKFKRIGCWVKSGNWTTEPG